MVWVGPGIDFQTHLPIVSSDGIWFPEWDWTHDLEILEVWRSIITNRPRSLLLWIASLYCLLSKSTDPSYKNEASILILLGNIKYFINHNLRLICFEKAAKRKQACNHFVFLVAKYHSVGLNYGNILILRLCKMI